MKMQTRHKWWRLAAGALLLASGCREAAPPPPGSPAFWQARSNDPETRGEALAALGKLHDPRAVALLREALQTAGPGQRDAALALGDAGDANVVPLLRSQIDAGARDEEHVRLNRAVLTALRTLAPKSALPSFLALLSSPVAEVRGDAVDAIGAAGDPNAASALMHVFLRDPQVEVGRRAGLALADVRAVDAIPDLVRALYRDAMYDTARLALVQMGSRSAALLIETLQRRNPAVEGLRGADPKQPLAEGTIEARAGAALGAIRAPAGAAPVTAAFTRLYQRYLAGPATADPSLFSAIIELAYAVGNFGGPAASRALLPMLRAPQETLRTTAAEAITNAGPQPGVARALLDGAMTGSADACGVFLQALSRVGNADDLDAVQKLAQVGTPEMAPAVMAQLLEDVSDRLQARRTCGDDVRCWTAKTSDASDRVRERAALELGWRHADGAVTALLRLAEDASADVRLAAVLSLQRMSKARVPLDALQKIYEAQGSKLQYAAANQELKCLIARQKDP